MKEFIRKTKSGMARGRGRGRGRGRRGMLGMGRKGMLEAQVIPPPLENKPLTLRDFDRSLGRGDDVKPLLFLVECATGYALFHAHGIHDIDREKFQPAEDYINRSDTPFELKSYLPFSSPNDALIEMNAISTTNFTDKLLNFIHNEFRPPFHHHVLVTANQLLGCKIAHRLKLSHRGGRLLISSVMRGLREKIDKFIGLLPGELDKAQRNLARLYNNQMLPKTTPVPVSSPSFLQGQLTVVPHRFEGFFIAKGKEDDNILCTRNLVPGEALNGENLILVQNDDGTEVEYRVCDPRRSKLGAAILGGVTNIWIKPGSRVMYVGDVCGVTVSDLSDLVGLDGLVYVVGFSEHVAHMAGKRPNVVPIIEKTYIVSHYRMLLSMADVIFGEIDHLPKLISMEGFFTKTHVCFYLKAGGHYMICTEANNRGHATFSCSDPGREFKLIQRVMLDLEKGAYALDIGGYRMPDE